MVLAVAALTVAGLVLAGAATARSTPSSGDRLSLAHFPDGPPARVTGGFGEETCGACHFDWDEGEAPGRMTVRGFPDCYHEGAAYDLQITLKDPHMVVAGFQLSVRADDGSQVGVLVRPDHERGRVAIIDDGGVLFAQHTEGGIRLAEPGVARWDVRWTAPAARQQVWLHSSGVAGDGDRSEAGDRVYALEQAASGAGCAAGRGADGPTQD